MGNSYIASWLNHKVKILRCVYIAICAYTGNPSWKLLSFTFRGFLNQACTGHKPARTWFLKIDPVQIVSMQACVCVCVSTPEAINN